MTIFYKQKYMFACIVCCNWLTYKADGCLRSLCLNNQFVISVLCLCVVMFTFQPKCDVSAADKQSTQSSHHEKCSTWHRRTSDSCFTQGCYMTVISFPSKNRSAAVWAVKPYFGSARCSQLLVLLTNEINGLEWTCEEDVMGLCHGGFEEL